MHSRGWVELIRLHPRFSLTGEGAVVNSQDFDDALEAAKLEALAEFAAGAGHEINNPLATILGRTELLLRRAGRLAPSGETAEATRDLTIIAGQVQRIRDMIGDLMLFARPPAPKPESCDLRDAARTAVAAIRSLAEAQGVQILEVLSVAVQIRTDRTQLAVMISELLRNALQATGDGGAIEVSVTATEIAGEMRGRLSIADNGAGLSESDLQHLFDPFYSGRQAGRGLGFGLCKCWRIAQLNSAKLRVEPRDGGGVVAVVEWPAG